MSQPRHTAPGNEIWDAEPTPRPTLTMQQRDEIMAAAMAYAAAERSHQLALDTNQLALNEAATVNRRVDTLNALLNAATSTEVNYDLLERTLERDRLADQADKLLQEKHALQAQLGGFELEREGNQSRTRDLQAQLDLSLELVNGVNAERDRLTGRLHTQIRSNDELLARATTAETERNDAIVELKVFKAKVVEVAHKYAADNGWCEVIDDALEELGLRQPVVKYAAKVDITVYLSATLNRDADPKEIPERAWVADQFTGMEEVQAFIKRRLGLSGEHANWAIDDVEYDVIEVTSNG